MILKNIIRYAIFALIAVFLFMFLLMPIYLVVSEGVKLSYIGEVFSNKLYIDGIINSLLIAVVTTLITLLIAFPLVLIFDKYNFCGKKWTSFLIMLPMILPPFVGALGIQQLLGYYGVFNSLLINHFGVERIDFLGGENRFFWVCITEALHLYPILYLNLISALGGIDPTLDEAAKNLGASKWRRFFSITLLLAKNGIFAGCSIILIWSFTELGTPLMFGFNRTMPVQIFNGLTELESNPLPYTLVSLMLVFSAVLYGIVKFIFRTDEAIISKGVSAGREEKVHGIGKLLPIGCFLIVALVSILPHIALILTAFGRGFYQRIVPASFTLAHFEEALSNKLVVPSIVNSLEYSLLATLIALFIGFMGAYIVIKWRLRGGIWLDILCMLPLAVPGIVIAFGYIGMSNEFLFAKKYLNPALNPFLLLGVAYAIRRIPYVIRSAASGLLQTPDDLEAAARNLGAGEFSTLCKITLPLILSNLIVGGLFAFSFSMLEVSDSLILAQKQEYYPITKALFELSQFLGEGPDIACAFGVWTMAFLASTLFGASILAHKKISSVFKL
ncbi:MAG: iron ABC transporter permease [Lentisphaeria bacterium]|nr:iron ABC transporter permease [Lentisphaeria bacterium]